MRLIRLILVSGLFLGWLGYLSYLVATRPRTADGSPLVLSRPQIMASDLDVIAELPARPGKPEVQVTVVEVLFPDNSGLKQGDVIAVNKLELCHPLRRTDEQPPDDWSGPGRYLLPLKRVPGQANHYEVAAIPPSPGFSDMGVYRIYPASSEALAQYRGIEKAEKEED
jgi:hypothetical protein